MLTVRNNAIVLDRYAAARLGKDLGVPIPPEAEYKGLTALKTITDLARAAEERSASRGRGAASADGSDRPDWQAQRAQEAADRVRNALLTVRSSNRAKRLLPYRIRRIAQFLSLLRTDVQTGAQGKTLRPSYQQLGRVLAATAPVPVADPQDPAKTLDYQAPPPFQIQVGGQHGLKPGEVIRVQFIDELPHRPETVKEVVGGLRPPKAVDEIHGPARGEKVLARALAMGSHFYGKRINLPQLKVEAVEGTVVTFSAGETNGLALKAQHDRTLFNLNQYAVTEYGCSARDFVALAPDLAHHLFLEVQEKARRWTQLFPQRLSGIADVNEVARFLYEYTYAAWTLPHRLKPERTIVTDLSAALTDRPERFEQPPSPAELAARLQTPFLRGQVHLQHAIASAIADGREQASARIYPQDNGLPKSVGYLRLARQATLAELTQKLQRMGLPEGLAARQALIAANHYGEEPFDGVAPEVELHFERAPSADEYEQIQIERDAWNQEVFDNDGLNPTQELEIHGQMSRVVRATPTDADRLRALPKVPVRLPRLAEGLHHLRAYSPYANAANRKNLIDQAEPTLAAQATERRGAARAPRLETVAEGLKAFREQYPERAYQLEQDYLSAARALWIHNPNQLANPVIAALREWLNPPAGQPVQTMPAGELADALALAAHLCRAELKEVMTPRSLPALSSTLPLELLCGRAPSGLDQYSETQRFDLLLRLENYYRNRPVATEIVSPGAAALRDALAIHRDLGRPEAALALGQALIDAELEEALHRLQSAPVVTPSPGPERALVDALFPFAARNHDFRKIEVEPGFFLDTQRFEKAVPRQAFAVGVTDEHPHREQARRMLADLQGRLQETEAVIAEARGSLPQGLAAGPVELQPEDLFPPAPAQGLAARLRQTQAAYQITPLDQKLLAGFQSLPAAAEVRVGGQTFQAAWDPQAQRYRVTAPEGSDATSTAPHLEKALETSLAKSKAATAGQPDAEKLLQLLDRLPGTLWETFHHRPALIAYPALQSAYRQLEALPHAYRRAQQLLDGWGRENGETPPPEQALAQGRQLAGTILAEPFREDPGELARALARHIGDPDAAPATAAERMRIVAQRHLDGLQKRLERQVVQGLSEVNAELAALRAHAGTAAALKAVEAMIGDEAHYRAVEAVLDRERKLPGAPAVRLARGPAGFELQTNRTWVRAVYETAVMPEQRAPLHHRVEALTIAAQRARKQLEGGAGTDPAREANLTALLYEAAQRGIGPERSARAGRALSGSLEVAAVPFLYLPPPPPAKPAEDPLRLSVQAPLPGAHPVRAHTADETLQTFAEEVEAGQRPLAPFQLDLLKRMQRAARALADQFGAPEAGRPDRLARTAFQELTRPIAAVVPAATVQPSA